MRVRLVILAIVVLFFGTGVGAVHALLAVYPDTTIIESESYFQSQPIPAGTEPGALHVPILIYHSVRPDFDGENAEQKRMNIPPDLFEKQLSYLADNGYTVISMDDLERDLLVGTTSPVAKPVVITFDDGWKNQIIYALPILQAHHMTATFYIYSNPIDHESPHFLSWDDIHALQRSGMTIGSHTITHPYLSHLTDEELAHEVTKSKHIIEERINAPVRHFASPFGYTSDKLVAFIQESGYHTGRTTYRGNHHTKADLLHLPGYMVERSWNNFVWNLRDSP